MTKEEREDTIAQVRMAFSIWESEFDVGDDWSEQHKARDGAIKALKQESILDKVKQAREEIENLTPWDEGLVEVHKVLSVLDKMISEVEE